MNYLKHLIQLTFFIVLFYWGGITSIYAQPIASDLNSTLSRQQLKEDFALMRSNLEALHIGLYNYCTKATLDSVFQEIEAQLCQPMTVLNFYNHLSKLNQPIGNGHTKFTPPTKLWDAIKKELPLFPLEVYWDKEQLYVLKNLSNNATIKEGAVIKSINSQSATVIFQKMVNSIRRDGYNTSYPIARSALSFPIIYAAQYDIPNHFEVEIEEPSQAGRNVSLQGLARKKRDANHLQRFHTPRNVWEDYEDPVLDLHFHQDQAILTIRSFALATIKKHDQHFKRFIKNAFKEIQKKRSQHLILDVRNNSGGQPEPTEYLLTYLLDQPFSLCKTIEAKVNQIPDSSYFLKDGSSIYFHKEKWEPKGDRFQSKDKSQYRMYQPRKDRFRGKFTLLINAFSASATGTFVGQLKSQQRGLIIGEETGGNPNLTVARNSVKLILPHSKMVISIPLTLSIKNVNFENTGRGAIPDHMIRPGIEDLLAKRDVAMELALELKGEQ